VLQSILLATDFRPASKEAGQLAVRLAAAFGSRVSLLHVIEPLPSWPVALHLFQDQAAGLLRQLADDLTGQNVTVADPVIAVGPPGDAIVPKAQELDVDPYARPSKLAARRVVPWPVSLTTQRAIPPSSA
jgi:nucleotide-binding universal stress UspA family protein